jgi:predicted nucleotidyltransferase
MMEHLAAVLAQIRGVVAVTLGGSRAQGKHRPESDWDFGLYYRGGLNAADVRRLGYRGTVVEPGEWGRLVNGGAWLTVDGNRVDLLYRDLDVVNHWTDEAEQGRFEVDRVFGYVAGMPTYVLAGELALAKVLQGTLPRPSFPPALQRSAPPRWTDMALFSLEVAANAAAREDVVECVGLLAQAALAAAHARLSSQGIWVLNEKGIVSQAGLAAAHDIVSAAGASKTRLREAPSHMRAALFAS